MAEKTARIIFEAVDNASSKIKNVKDGLSEFERTSGLAKGQFESLGAIISNVAPWVGLGTVIGGLTAVIKSSVKEWAEEEQSIIRLKNAVALAYDDVGRATVYFERMAQSLQDNYGIADSLARQMIQLAIRFGAPTSEIRRLVIVANDMSKALGIDSETAITMLIRAGNGMLTFLRRMGVVIDESVVKSRGLSGVLDEVGKKFEGLGEEYLGTVQGAMVNLSYVMSDLKEEIGKMVVESSGMVTIFTYVAYSIKGVNDEATGLALAFQGVGWTLGAVIKLVLAFVDLVATGFKQLGDLIAGFTAAVTFALEGDFKKAGQVIKDTFADINREGNASFERIIDLYTNNTNAFRKMVDNQKGMVEEFKGQNKLAVRSVEEVIQSQEDLQKSLEKTRKEIEEKQRAALTILVNKYKEAKKEAQEIKVEFENIPEPEPFKVSEEYLRSLRSIIVYEDAIINKSMELSAMVSDAFISAIVGAKGFGEALRDLIRDISLYIVKALIMATGTQAIFSLLGISEAKVVSNLGANWRGFGNLFMRFLGFSEGGVVKGIRTFQEGGVVTRPTLAIVGEGGEPEYIIPKSKFPEPQVYVNIFNATPKTYVEVFTTMDKRSLKVIKGVLASV